MTTESLTLEPRTRNDLFLSLLSSVAIGVSAMGMIGMPLGAAYLVWMMPAWEFAAVVGVLLAGVEVSCGFVIARLTRDDRSIGRRLALGDAALAQLPGVLADRDKWRKIGEGAQPVVLPVKDDSKFVAPRVRDAAWTDARTLLMLVQGDFGRVAGRTSSGLTQQAQDAAIQVLVNAGLLKRKGNQYELLCTRAEAVARLDAIP